MDRRITRWVSPAVGMVLMAGLAGAAAGPVERPQEPDVLQALLVEVRGLRAAMEQMASAGPRIQLALGRLQLQEQRVNSMVRRYDDVRARIESEERQATQMRDALAGAEERLRRVIDPAERELTEQEIRSVKSMLERNAADRQRLTVEEASAAQAVAAEQGRWMEINAQLEALERALAGLGGRR